ncbi:hypothetical protein ACTFIZ_008920 [Dictyostelium cf. discoideum]
MNKYLIFLILTSLNIITCVGQKNCQYYNANKGISYDLTPLKRDSSDPWTATSKIIYGFDNLYKFNFCNVTVDKCHGTLPGESPLNIYSTACQSNFYQTGSTIEAETVQFPENGLTIITSSSHIEPTKGNDCSGSSVPNRRRMKFYFICDINKGLFTNKTEVYEPELCTYQIEYYSSLVCNCSTGCSNHGICNENGGCKCDSKTSGNQCEISNIIITQVLYSREIQEDNLEIIGFFGIISLISTTVKIGNSYTCNNIKQQSETNIKCTMINKLIGEQILSYTDGDLSYNFSKNFGTCTSHGIYNKTENYCKCDTQTSGEICQNSLIVIDRIEFLTTTKNTNLSLLGYFGTISIESTILVGELQCNNIKQINETNIECQVDIPQFGEKNVKFTDHDLSYTFLKDFGKCTTNHGIYNNTENKCKCDTQTIGESCQNSLIVIDKIEFLTTTKNTKLLLIGYFGTITNESTIYVGELQCNNKKQINEINIECQVDIPQFGPKNVTFVDNDLSFTFLKDFGNCTYHGIYNKTENKCKCDTQTIGESCQNSLIVIDRIDFSTTTKNTKLSLIGYFGIISIESTIHVGELKCNNIKQMNEFKIDCQLDILQFGQKNVILTDNDLSFTFLKDFGNCTSHGKYEDNLCLCDSKTKGDHCEISKIFINSVNSPTINGGLTFIYGFFGNISENSTIEIGLNQCINIIQYNHSTIQCEIGAGVGIHDVTINDDDLIFTLLKSFEYTPIQKPKCSQDEKPCGGISQGVCTYSGCVCKSPWVGIDCSSKVIIIPQPSKNDSNPTIEFETNGEQVNKYNNNTLFKSIISIVKLRELDFNSKEVNSFDFIKWEFYEIDNTTYIYKSNISTSENKNENSNSNTDITVTLQWFEKETNISFANSDIKMNPSSIKYTIEMSKYNFKNKLNRLQLIISAMMIMDNPDEINICSNKEFGETIKEENSNYLKIQIDNHSIYGRFIKRAIVDTSKIITLENTMLDSLTLSEININSKNDNVSHREAFIGITIPYYQDQIIIDPDFSMLLDTKEISSTNSICSNINESGLSASKLAAIIICSILFAVVIVVGTTYIYFKKKYDKDLVESIKMKTKKVEIFITIYVGELQCNNIKQINEINIECQVYIPQFGRKNVILTDKDLSFTFLKDFGNCTSHGNCENNSCVCDSKTKGNHCEISIIFISYVNSPTINGGLTFIYGFFGNISENSTIDIGPNQCINITQFDETRIQCEIGAGVRIHDVTIKDDDLIFTLLKSFENTPLVSPKCSQDDKPCGGISQGVCTNSGCVCKSPWVGVDCSSKVIIIPQPSKNGEEVNKYNNNTYFKSIISIVKLRELDFYSKEISSFNFNKWEFKEIDNTTYIYKSSISTTVITITLKCDIKMNPSSIKYTIYMSKYNFKNKLNRLQSIISEIMIMDNPDYKSICSNKEFGETIKEENSNYLKIHIDNHSIYGRFIKRAIVDTSKIITIENTMLDSSTLSEININSKNDNVSHREAFIGITIPYYKD